MTGAVKATITAKNKPQRFQFINTRALQLTLPVSAGRSLAHLNTGLRITKTPANPGQHDGKQVKYRFHPHVQCRSGAISHLVPKVYPEKVAAYPSGANDDGEP